MAPQRAKLSRKLKFGIIDLHLHPTVFGVSAFVIISVVFATLLNLGGAEAFFTVIKNSITTYFGWLLILFVQGFLLFCVYLALSRFGQIRIGGPDARPDFSRTTWFAMLFSAGMGIGLLFYGVAEPVLHFHSPPGMTGGTFAAATRAMDLTFLHWGLHAWSIYALVALSLAYFSYNRGLPLTIRSAFYPIIGDRIYGPAGTVIDVLAVVATLFGVARTRCTCAPSGSRTRTSCAPTGMSSRISFCCSRARPCSCSTRRSRTPGITCRTC
ncbi:MAG: BCCT family transporter [Xanthomonadales bacterium]